MADLDLLLQTVSEIRTENGGRCLHSLQTVQVVALALRCGGVRPEGKSEMQFKNCQCLRTMRNYCGLSQDTTLCDSTNSPRWYPFLLGIYTNFLPLSMN